MASFKPFSFLLIHLSFPYLNRKSIPISFPFLGFNLTPPTLSINQANSFVSKGSPSLRDTVNFIEYVSFPSHAQVSMDEAKRSKYISLKDLASLPPQKSATPPYPGNMKTRYVKVKKPLFKDGIRVYWQEISVRDEDA